MTAEQKERARHEVEVEKARQLKRIADALEIMAGMVPLSEQLGSVLTPNELRELHGVKPIPSTQSMERPHEAFERKITGKRAETNPVDDYISDGLDTIAEILMNNMKQED